MGKDGLCHRGCSQTLSSLSTIETFTSSGSTPSLGVAQQTLVQITLGLCRSISWTPLHSPDGCILYKWIVVELMPSITSAKTIEKLRMIFSTHGLPQKLVTDNRANFTSSEFLQFTEKNGIKHVTLAPYYPSTNGLAERAVQTFKRAIERMHNLPIQDRLSKFLLTYRLTPHTTTGIAPAELLMGRRPHSLLDNLIPDLSQKLEYRQVKQKLSHDSSKSVHNFEVGDSVFAENITGKSPKWISSR